MAAIQALGQELSARIARVEQGTTSPVAEGAVQSRDSAHTAQASVPIGNEQASQSHILVEQPALQ